jgi:DNA-binding NtrC family response regulator
MQSDQYKNKNNDGVVKIIATSCKSLFDLTCADKFNKLLFYKLNITPVEVPSINKRRYDIPLLLDYWLKKFNEINNKNIQLDAKCIRYLRNRYWPGNIAQIKTLIEKLVLAARDKNSNISMNMLEKLLSEREVEFVEEQSFLSFNSLEDAKQNFERKYLLYILRKSNFDLQQTSEKLNISISVLSDKVSKLNINLKSLNSN